MPYIVKTYLPGGQEPDQDHAVATLDNAKDEARSSVVEPDTFSKHDAIQAAIDVIPDVGDTIGPLSDGTVIEVELATWHDLIDAVGGFPQIPESASDPLAVEIIDAYNSRP